MGNKFSRCPGYRRNLSEARMKTRRRRLTDVVAGAALLVALGWLTPAEAADMTVGTAGGNKTVTELHVGTAGGNKLVTEGWVGTASGNKQFLQSSTDGFYGDIVAAGLTSGLKVCLDAGASLSYSGSGQDWLDMSGNGHDFYRGISGSSEASDPTFNGTAGAETGNEYWSFDGGDYFVCQDGVQSWMSNMHKDGAVFSVVCAFYYSGGQTAFAFLGTDTPFTNPGAGVAVGYFLYGKSSFDWIIRITDDSGNVLTNAFPGGAGAAAPSIGWNIIGISINEATGATSLYKNGTGYTNTGVTYATPSSSAASRTMSIASGSTTTCGNGDRMAVMAIWEGVALSNTDFGTLYNAIKGRYGL